MFCAVDSQLDGATDVSSPPTWSAQLHQQPAGSNASRNSQTATVSAASVAAVPSAPTQPAVDPLSCLPETVRQCLNGCIPCVRTPERGVNLALYITPADSNGKLTATSPSGGLMTFSLVGHSWRRERRPASGHLAGAAIVRFQRSVTAGVRPVPRGWPTIRRGRAGGADLPAHFDA